MKIPQSKEIQTVETGALGLPIPADQLMSVSSPDSRLPNLKIINSIEVDPGKGITKDMAGMIVLQASDTTTIVPKNSVITVLAARDGVRQLMVDFNGATIPFEPNNPAHAKLEKKYERAFKGMGKFTKSHEAFMLGLSNLSFQKGSVYLLALLTEEGCSICELNAFKVQASYWYRPLSQGVLHPQKLGIQLLDNDHSNNLKASKADSSHKYFDPSKFTQWKSVELTGKQLADIAGAVAAAKQDIDGWFDR